MNSMAAVQTRERERARPISGSVASMFPPDRRQALREVSLWELLLWTYREQRAAALIVQTRDWLNLAVALSDLADAETPRAVLHPDAASVHGVVMQLGGKSAVLIHAAERGEAPEPCDLLPLPCPADVDRSRDLYRRAEWQGRLIDYKIVVVERVAETVPIMARNARGRRHVVGHETRITEVEACPIDWSPDPIWVQAVNGHYAAWCAAMDDLRESLAGVPLKMHRLVD